MIEKDKRSKFLQKQLDDKEFSNSFNFIKKMKGVDSTAKLLLIEMCNDLYMNGDVTWKQSTYADKLGLTRQQISNWFKKFVTLQILLPHSSNKAGGKQNKYGINHNYFSKLGKPVKPSVPTCKAGDTLPVKPGIQTCKEDFTYNKDNKDNKSLLSKEGAFAAPPLKEGWELEFLTKIDI